MTVFTPNCRLMHLKETEEGKVIVVHDIYYQSTLDKLISHLPHDHFYSVFVNKSQESSFTQWSYQYRPGTMPIHDMIGTYPVEFKDSRCHCGNLKTVDRLTCCTSCQSVLAA